MLELLPDLTEEEKVVICCFLSSSGIFKTFGMFKETISLMLHGVEGADPERKLLACETLEKMSNNIEANEEKSTEFTILQLIVREAVKRKKNLNPHVQLVYKSDEPQPVEKCMGDMVNQALAGHLTNIQVSRDQNGDMMAFTFIGKEKQEDLQW